jgi:protein-S-isoprenylcysteine O-methyltransferase Ste14
MSQSPTLDNANSTAGTLPRMMALVYGIISYVIFLASFLYAIGFVSNLLVPKSIDTGPQATKVESLAVNLVLLAIFALQHSVMARPAFKRWWTTLAPAPIERSTYVLASSLVLLLLFWQWRPLPHAVWNVQNQVVAAALWALFGIGWCAVLVSTFLIDHFDLFGLRQVVFFAAGREYVAPQFKLTAFYRVVRHPIMLGFIVAFWATPLMSWGHLLFAAVTTAYVVIAVHLEERDLRAAFGTEYEEYQQRVSMLVPWLPRPRRTS